MDPGTIRKMRPPSSPFVGLAAFTPRMAAYFTGRERFALTLAGAVLRSPVTVLYGQSGAGKTSLLWASFPQILRATLRLVPATIESPPVAIGRALGDQLELESAADARLAPVSSLRARAEAAISLNASTGLRQPAPFRLLNFRRWHPGFETRLRHAAAAKLGAPKDSSLASAVAGWAQDRKVPVILVLDQFEEFLLYHPEPAETSFVQNLAAIVADPDSEAHVLLSLREDSLASLDALRAVIPGILSSPVQLRPLDRTAASQAIRKPVAKWSEDCFGDSRAIEVEPALVDTLLDQVQHASLASSSADPISGAPASLVELPLLQLTLERLWEEAAKAGKLALRPQTLEQLGGAAGIARQHLDQTMGDLKPAQRALAIRLFRHLVTATGGKHAWRAEDLAEEIIADSRAEAEAVGQMTGVGQVDAAGRELLGIVDLVEGPEATKAAVNETLGKLAEGKARILRAQPDPRGHGPLFELYHDALARPVLYWAQQARIEEAGRRFSRLYALYQQAQLQEARAVSTLARQATKRGDAMTGMLAALAVLPKDPAKPNRPISNAATAALLDAWLRNREKYTLLGHSRGVASVAFSPDGKRVVTGSSDSTARVWDLSGPTPAATVLEGHSGSIQSVAFSPDGKRVVTGSSDSTARVWDLSGPTPTATVLEGHRSSIQSVAFCPDGKRVVTGSSDNTARVWDLFGPTPTATVLEGHRGRVTSVAFSPDGKRVVTGSADYTARVWDLSRPIPTSTLLDGHRGMVGSVAFSPDGKRVVTGSDDTTARV